VAQNRSSPYFVLFALWLMVFSASSQVIIITPILPEIGAALGVSESLQSLLVTSYAVALSCFAIITGPISDKIGRQRILLVGTSFMAGVLVLHGFANTYPLLLTVRTLAGCAGGMLSGGAVAYIGDYFPYERRGWANGWVMSGIAVGQVVGIPLGKVLANAFGYQWPFLMFALTMGVAAVLIARYVPQPDVELDRDRLSVKRGLLNYARLIRQPTILAAVMAYFLMFFGIGLYVVFLPTWLEQDIGVSGNQIALLFAVGGLANVAAGPVAGRASDEMGRKPLIVTSCLGLGVLMVLTTFVVTNFFWAVALFALSMVMVAMRISPLQSLLTALVPDARRGLLMSLAVGIGQVGIGLGSFIAGISFVEYGYFSNTVIGALSVVLMAALVQFGLPEPELPSSAETPSAEASSAKRPAQASDDDPARDAVAPAASP
jgi:predicted MFS family arabinose efflux permease